MLTTFSFFSGLAYSATSLWGLVVVLQGSLAYLVGSGLMVMLAFWWVAAALALTRLYHYTINFLFL